MSSKAPPGAAGIPCIKKQQRVQGGPAPTLKTRRCEFEKIPIGIGSLIHYVCRPNPRMHMGGSSSLSPQCLSRRYQATILQGVREVWETSHGIELQPGVLHDAVNEQRGVKVSSESLGWP